MNEVMRQEKKYLLNTVDVLKTQSVIEKIMHEDIHNKGTGYTIRSLYFDTLNDKDLNDKNDGIENRRKIRLRIYDQKSDFAMLEMKQKQDSFQRKRTLKLSREDANKLIQGNYSILLSYKEAFALECFYLMNSMCYKPKSIVEYTRKAYIASENQTRITFDSNIIATEANTDLFSDTLLMYPVFKQCNTVLEVKFNGFLLSYIKDLVKITNSTEVSISKYCLSRQVGLRYSF